MNIFGRVYDWFGSLFADAEDVVHGPLYPVTEYQAQVTPSIWRGAWPSVDTLKKLRNEGIRTVVNLCSERIQDELVISLGMASYNISIKDTETPSLYDCATFRSLVYSSSPLFVHCEEGVGRTGCIIADYRVTVQGWAPEDALAEAQYYGRLMPRQIAFIRSLIPQIGQAPRPTP